MHSKIKIIVPLPDQADKLCDILIQSIVHACVADHQNDPDAINDWLANKTPENVVTWLESSSNISFAALDMSTHELVGFLLMNTQGDILLNYLLPNYLHKGIGKALLTEAEEKAKDMGLRQLMGNQNMFALF